MHPTTEQRALTPLVYQFNNVAKSLNMISIQLKIYGGIKNEKEK